jgi:hypothetical protein
LRNIYLLAKSIEAPKKKNQNSVVAQYHRLQHCDQRWASTYFGGEKSSISFSIQRTQTGTKEKIRNLANFWLLLIT